MRLEAIEADSQARARIVQRTETVRSRKFSPQRLGILCPGSRRVPGTRGIASQDLPKSLTLLKKAALQRTRIRLPKNLTVTAAVSKMSMPSDTYVQQAFRCVRRSPPEKPHLCGRRTSAAAVYRLLKTLTCAKKWHSKNQISASPGGLFSEFAPLWVPKRLTFALFSSKWRSRKDSPIRQTTACDRCPEKAHLNGIRAGKPGFRSRKASPFRLHRPHRALLLCKMTVGSRKSSQQIPVESRETSPFMKTAQKMGRIGARVRSRKFSPMSAQAENCARRHSAGSMAVRPRKTSPLGNLAFHCDPESAHDLSCIGSRRSPNPITSAPAEDHLGSRKTSPCRPESLAT